MLNGKSEAYLRQFFSRWYRSQGRSFPWRAERVSPFHILIAEMLLRQTRAEMVPAVWTAFTDLYPTPAAVVEASNDELYALVSPLGFGAQRTGAIQSVAGSLLEKHNDLVPRSIEKLLALPHIGLYSAHAVACFAFGRRLPVVDVNVLRVFSRLTGEPFGIDNRRGRAPEAWELATRILPSRNARDHNYGLLDFSAAVCTSRSPKHHVCPLTQCCAFYQSAVRVRNREHES